VTTELRRRPPIAALIVTLATLALGGLGGLAEAGKSARTASRPARAAIDVGSASVKAVVSDPRGRIVLDAKIGSGLGQGVVPGKPLPAANQARTLAAIRSLRQEAHALGVKDRDIQLVMTAAARNATTPPSSAERHAGARTGRGFLRRVQRLGIGDARILSAAEEADLGYRGAILGLAAPDAAPSTRPVLVIDTGGGSHQLTLGTGEAINFKGSTQIGSHAVRERILAGLESATGTLDDDALAVADAELVRLVPELPRDATTAGPLGWRPSDGAEVVLTGGFAHFLRGHFQKDRVTRAEVVALRRELARRDPKARRAYIERRADGSPLSADERLKLGLDRVDGKAENARGASLPAKASLILRLFDLLDLGGPDASITLSTTDARHALVGAPPAR
jgi:hypothetical protein